MAYRIDYSDGGRQAATREKKHSFRAVLICFFLFLILVQLFWPQGREAIQKFLLPGATEAAWAAVDGFANQVRTGEPIGDALETLCRNVFQSAGILH